MPFRLIPRVALVALASSAAIAQAQSLGGMLNSAKAKVSQARAAASGSAAAPSPGTQNPKDCSGMPPARPEPEIMTPEVNDQWTRAVLANCRPYAPDQTHDSFEYDHTWRRVHFGYKAPLRFTWDRSYVEMLGSARPLMGLIDQVCEPFSQFCGPVSDYNPQVVHDKAFKVKVIHLTTIKQRPAGTDQGGGYAWSWNQATGTLTLAAFSSAVHQLDDKELSSFLVRNVK